MTDEGRGRKGGGWEQRQPYPCHKRRSVKVPPFPPRRPWPPNFPLPHQTPQPQPQSTCAVPYGEGDCTVSQTHHTYID